MKDSFVLPIKWCVLNPDNEESKLLYDYATKSTGRNYEGGSYFHFPDFDYYGLCCTSPNINKGYTKITFDEFKKHVLKMGLDSRFPFKLSYEDATSIVDAACNSWQDKLSKLWGAELLKNRYVSITELFYTEMRGACTASQNILFDKIFGADTIECPYKEGEWIAVRDCISTNWVIKECLGEMSGQRVKTVVNPGEWGVWSYHMSLTDFNNKFNANTTPIKVGDYVRIKVGQDGFNFDSNYIHRGSLAFGHWNRVHRIFLVQELGPHHSSGADLVYGTAPDSEVCFKLSAVEKVSAAEYNKQI